MAKFFIPHAKNSQHADKVWLATKQFMKDQGYSVTDRKLYSIKYKHNGKHLEATVGEKDGYEQEEVIAIFESSSSLFLCCTPNRGVLRGGPILIGNDLWTRVTDFEQEK